MIRSAAPIQCHARRGGFSLVEVLVVITILAVLAALALPTYRSVRAKADLNHSVSVLKQLQHANQLYASENNGLFVPARARAEKGGYVTRWVDNHQYLAYLGLEKGESWPRTLLSPRAGVLDANGYPNYARCWGMNKEGFTGYSDTTAWDVSAFRLKDAHRTIVFTDALDWMVSYAGASKYPGAEIYTGSAVAYRYNGLAGVAFYDGHVEALSIDDLVKDPELWKIRQ